MSQVVTKESLKTLTNLKLNFLDHRLKNDFSELASSQEQLVKALTDRRPQCEPAEVYRFSRSVSSLIKNETGLEAGPEK